MAWPLQQDYGYWIVHNWAIFFNRIYSFLENYWSAVKIKEVIILSISISWSFFISIKYFRIKQSF